MADEQQLLNTHEKKFYDSAPRETTEVYKNIWRIVPPEPSCNVYVIRDELKTVMIDTGLYQTWAVIRTYTRPRSLPPRGMRPPRSNSKTNT